VAGTDYAVEIDSVDALQKQWRQGAGAVAAADQTLARACSRAGEIAFETAVAKPHAMPLLNEAVRLLELARAAADRLVAALDADVVRLGQCAANYRQAEEQIIAKLHAVRPPALPSVPVRPPTHAAGPPADGPRDQPPPAYYANQGQVNTWISEAFAALESTGVPGYQLDASGVLTIIEHESSGNPNATNLWDSNAQAGQPSKGLMQTIGSTFDSYKLPGHDDIYNPVDNIIAGVRYAISRYGSISDVPGVRAVNGGGSYVGY
jgi:soluble lytic murein transglycosylase-like protein